MMIIGLLIIVLFTYLGLIFKFNYGWDNLKIYEENHITSVSIVIAARNEESNICNLIDDLKGQIYPSNLIEIIVVDDHSNDNTFELLKKETFIRVVSTMYFIGSFPLYGSLMYYGLGTINDLYFSLLLIIPALIGQQVGSRIRNKISENIFRNFVLIILFILGFALLFKTL